LLVTYGVLHIIYLELHNKGTAGARHLIYSYNNNSLFLIILIVVIIIIISIIIIIIICMLNIKQLCTEMGTLN